MENLLVLTIIGAIAAVVTVLLCWPQADGKRDPEYLDNYEVIRAFAKKGDK
jgi:hypothetical protein